MGFVREQPEVSLGKETLGLPESYKQCLVKNVSLPAESVSQGGAPQQQGGAGSWYAAAEGWSEGLTPVTPRAGPPQTSALRPKRPATPSSEAVPYENIPWESLCYLIMPRGRLVDTIHKPRKILIRDCCL